MFHNLPEEILQIVVEHMSSSDWARARGSCKSFSKVQPRQVALFPQSMAAVRWCTKLWEQADIIALNLGLLDIESAELCDILERGIVMLSRSVAELKIVGLDTDRTTCLAWLDSMLSKATCLQRLVLAADTIYTLPSFSQLQHLVLYVEAELMKQACSSIEGMKRLETISITGIHQDSCAQATIPALDLKGCRNLRAACFWYAMPEALLGAPEGCWIMMECHVEMMLHCWDGYSQFCTGVLMHDVALKPLILSLPCPWLTYLDIKNIGLSRGVETSILISGAMPYLCVLKIHCGVLSLRIETSAHLRILEIYAPCIMEFFVRDIAALTDHMVSLRLYGRVNPESVLAQEFVNKLKAAFKEKLVKGEIMDDVGWKHVEPIQDLLSGQARSGSQEKACACGGSCLYCLINLGVLQSK